ncbi:double-stranded RNA-binding protein 2 [Cajanus cajan]|uniref:Ribonuclease 3 n=1 Tax=Cajanus cajan TaxID=3821 RepID=A0A151TXG6_CAJCA|nr:double-stranded RNA-binding protein 2 [Cajanus cajan]XP_020210828.1 double-stranded RNA-binding protein 2 [Cajanus cajan]XP_020210829.1 double-stranded RNA-binding protein 2 [Cajanus cajan]XP_029126960.1 double-stranded RNA-binding protein 2 [Cajanus cajan]KYP71763.1 Ribonuclease 3 [Cajanus cajan]
MYKNRLQELAQRSCFNLPAYSCIREGPDHAPRFKATVNFNGETFESPTFCSTLRQAEHAAAEVALNTLAKRGPSRALAARVLDETGVYKNLLQETAHRAGLNLPVYTTIRSGPGHGPNFSCTVEIAEMHFTGDPARTKKQAQKNAAMAAWSALRKFSEDSLSSTSSSLTPECKGEEQEQVIIARVLASLHSASNKFSKSDNQHGWQKSATSSLVSIQSNADMYPMQCQHCGISSLSPEVALYQMWQQEQIMQQQNRLLALTIQPIIPSAPQIYPSVFQPDHCLYFPARELASVPVGPKFSIATSTPSFYLSNQIVPELNTGRSTLTIREIQEEKTEDTPVCTFSNESRVLTPAPEDERQKQGEGSGSRGRNAELGGEQCEKSEWDSHWSMGSVHRPVNTELQNPSSIGSSILRSHSQVSSNRSFRPPAASSSSIVRTMCPTSYVGSRPQHGEVPLAVASRLRTGIPRNPGIPTSERFSMIRAPAPLFMAPAVRIRSVVPVCSAPPRRSMAEASKSKEKEDLKPEDREVSRTSSELGHLRI